ncbi:pseudouridine synthase [Asticcacaulis benevestitus]|uniref:Pseudouridine synthase n=1 Tax=Asticcacaulis benevestitus DSM 16100 = ATCC BAA-896 TaxID=1121022 RepID=V4Q3B2_9CAUL|nr:16S rRNA pseudouridine(516) synthase [Asticcacaulis benevestitus]ESQ94174.1 pseudouridine synthase [Asticcacaulis benevestitus DSM 16100 = ATCC BAA-896]
MKLIKRLANLGYGSRKEMQKLIRMGAITDAAGSPLDDDSDTAHADIRYKGRPLDPDFGMVLLMHKPTGYVCSLKDRGQLVYELLPARFAERKPVLSSIGRLDADTSGLLLFTDDGDYLHKIISPKNHVAKIYEVTCARPLEPHYGTVFAAGTLVLENEKDALKPAFLDVTGEKAARLTLYEGRYHQVRRMFAAVGNHVETLHRAKMGPLTLGDLKPGKWRLLSAAEAQGLLIQS